MGWVHNNILLPLCQPDQHSGLSRRLQALKRFDALSRPEQLAVQEKRIRSLLDHAYETCPYYRLVFDEMGTRGVDWRQGQPIPVPVLTRDLLRVNFENLGSRAFRPDQLRRAQNGGTQAVFRDLEGMRDKTALEYHLNRLYGYDQGMPVLRISGPEYDVEEHPAWRRRFYEETLLGRMNCRVEPLEAATFSNCLEKLNQQRSEIIYGDPGTLALFAKWLRNSGRRWHKPRLVIAAGDALSTEARGVLEDTFDSAVTLHYGSPDIGIIAFECPEGGRLHIHPWASYVALVPAGQSSAGPLYRLIITDLLNYGMPLLRYDTGDCVLYDDSPCPCGSWYPSIAVLGRKVDNVTSDLPRAAHPGPAPWISRTTARADAPTDAGASSPTTSHPVRLHRSTPGCRARAPLSACRQSACSPRDATE
jgi:phenylacetate-CoA ligase